MIRPTHPDRSTPEAQADSSQDRLNTQALKHYSDSIFHISSEHLLSRRGDSTNKLEESASGLRLRSI
ncbi:hypothetical protein RSOLAG1IB_05410 [Rhizoctonia solani AG-1 IB]|uniref:Uncharacterized protein n=1 Tax=Thanatephorus cucumeris (strain AG1-IB / isolate 7/3/14) TaxID=1108050 RepID=A0A0B7G072_THACB|nr:hypothetical protein RSOLAG1IB_05410 [Rhizoctonia solani AG-1 IB]